MKVKGLSKHLSLHAEPREANLAPARLANLLPKGKVLLRKVNSQNTIALWRYSRVMPELEEMSSDIRQWARILVHYLQVLLSHLPYHRVSSLKQSWVMKITFWGITKRNSKNFISG